MLLVSLLFKGKLSYTVISFSIHGYLLQFLMSIRGIETVIVEVLSIGVLSSFLLCIEGYLWLVLLSIIFYFKENKKNGCNDASVSQQAHGTIKEELGKSGKERSKS
jgi:hypothetical protein